jgi:putative ATP-binding cassette transporter
VQRLVGFERTLARVRAEAAQEGVRRGPGADAGLALERVDLTLPHGRRLVEGVTLDLRPGDTALISGPSGAGKSTLFRAIAGIWPFGRGDIRLPREGRLLFLPQKPYLPIGTLREVVSYPTPAGGIDDAALREALEAVGLPALAARLDEHAHWALALSPGEQQRIAFARALVQRPDWLFLDEATSAVDEESEASLYGLLRDRLPGAALVSVGHRGSLRPFHARRLVVSPGLDGASVAEVPQGRPGR